MDSRSTFLVFSFFFFFPFFNFKNLLFFFVNIINLLLTTRGEVGVEGTGFFLSSFQIFF